MYSIYNCRMTDYLNFRRTLVRPKGRFSLRILGLNNIITAHLLTLKYRTIHESLDEVSDRDKDVFFEQIERSAKARGFSSQ